MNNRFTFLPPVYCLILFFLPALMNAASLEFRSSEAQTSLLELYTSEGCSSCPPAETWLSKLKDSPRLWKDFVPVAFHVDYWNYLGWRDPWSSAAFSDRQRGYSQFWRNDSIYTPGFVLNGKEWRNWSHAKEPDASKGNAGILTLVSADSNHWHITYALANHTDKQFEVYAALLANNLASDVKAGENRGRRLVHDFVVLTLRSKPLESNAAGLNCDFAFGADYPNFKPTSIAAWVTPLGSLEPLQAVGGSF